MSSTLRTAASVVLLAGVAAGALAEPTPAPGARPGTAATPAGLAAAASGASTSNAPRYRSAFENYQPFTDQPVQPWRDSNDTVGRIGGWKSYAREGQGDTPPGGEGMPDMPGMKGGHGSMNMAPAASAPTPRSPAASAPGTAKPPMKMVPPKAPATGAPSRSAPAPAPSPAMPAGHSGHSRP